MFSLLLRDYVDRIVFFFLLVEVFLFRVCNWAIHTAQLFSFTLVKLVWCVMLLLLRQLLLLLLLLVNNRTANSIKSTKLDVAVVVVVVGVVENFRTKLKFLPKSFVGWLRKATTQYAFFFSVIVCTKLNMLNWNFKFDVIRYKLKLKNVFSVALTWVLKKKILDEHNKNACIRSPEWLPSILFTWTN